jgi:selenocysteine lyase/cysteine desulfurase
MDRRKFLQNSGFAMGASLVLPALSCTSSSADSSTEESSKELSLDSWIGVRNHFNLTADRIHMSQMLLASHPTPVREAIEKHRKNFDENPFEYWENNWIEAEKVVTQAAGNYIKADPAEIVLTDSTTVGLAVLFSGLNLKPGNEILTTTHDHYSTEKSLEFASKKNGATIKRISLYSDPATITADLVTDELIKSITPATRIIAVTWVHSVTGVKLPIRKMADAIKTVNEKRTEADRIYFCVDGVHGFGVENITMEDLGCDFFVAGTHKWIFGPRGTGILWGKKEAWDMVSPIIPAFREAPYSMWMGIVPEAKLSFSDLCSPGGFLAFEHRWSLNEAFDFHMWVFRAKNGSGRRGSNRSGSACRGWG